ncbi:hypothetical protein CTAYLR_002508 [Chrysophaeum taylorii]|uniref:Uncharacterized protein n=1 Tax=Chrysophaeum taylorii TaxID=2483200 RepID=A0AAD7UGU1_9STRA|nr:hypothetical protein CTAYLR_002508 [Chrysophaeum taylorii]
MKSLSDTTTIHAGRELLQQSSIPDSPTRKTTHWSAPTLPTEKPRRVLRISGKSSRNLNRAKDGQSDGDESNFSEVGDASRLARVWRCAHSYLTDNRALMPDQLHYWDIGVGGLIVIYACFWDTYSLTYEYEHSMRWYDAVFDAVFWVDIILVAQTAYVKSGYYLVTDRRNVFNNYCRTWLWADLLANIPWDAVVQIVFGRGILRKELLQMLAFVGVFRVLRAPRIIKRVTAEWNIHSVKLSFTMYSIFTLLIAHLLACLFFLCPHVFDPTVTHTWRTELHVDDKRPGEQYLVSLYWSITTMTTLGYGDVKPVRSSEIALVVIAEVIGASSFALLVMHIQKLYDVIVQEDGVTVKRRNDIMMYLDQMQVKRDLKNKIMSYLSYETNLHTYSSFDDNDPRFQGLTDALKVELRVEVFLPILRRSLVFRKVPGELTHAMARNMHSRPCSPGEAVITPGTYRERTYIILAGELLIADDGIDEEHHRPSTMRWNDANNVIGIVAILDDDTYDALASMTKNIYAVANDHCSLAYIERGVFRDRVLPVVPDSDLTLLEHMAELCGVGENTTNTIWVGGIPADICTTAWLGSIFRKFGKIATISCRVKPPKEGTHKSWSHVTFWSEEDAKAVAALETILVLDGTVTLKVQLNHSPNKARALAILSKERMFQPSKSAHSGTRPKAKHRHVTGKTPKGTSFLVQEPHLRGSESSTTSLQHHR